MKLFSKNKAEVSKLPPPEHLAIIMDGNGRWATKRGLPRTAGHAAGAETFRKIAYYCRDIGIKHFTVYAFSTENWKRSEKEVEAIMALLEDYLIEAIEKMENEGISLKILGDTTVLSPRIRSLIEDTATISKRIDGFRVYMCVNYGGRDEILRAAKAYAKDYPERGDISEAEFGEYLYSAGIPDPDLIIRPSGELRTSNFLLWQSAYSEYYFTDVLWPDFSPKDIDTAIEAYHKRSRRFGGVK